MNESLKPQFDHPNLTRQQILNVATTAANMMDGMRVSGDKERFEAVVGDAWQQGFLELTQHLAEYALLSELALVSRPDQDFPGVYDYEVSYCFGNWFANELLEHDEAPQFTFASMKLLSMIDEFFAQGIKG